MFQILRCQLDMRHDFARPRIPLLLFVCSEKASAGSRKILTGACLFCESVQLCYVKSTLLSHSHDSGRNTAAIQHRLETYGARSLDRYLICSSRPNFPDDYLYRFSTESVAVCETRQSITHPGPRIKLLVILFPPSYRNPIKTCIAYMAFWILLIGYAIIGNGPLFQIIEEEVRSRERVNLIMTTPVCLPSFFI